MGMVEVDRYCPVLGVHIVDAHPSDLVRAMTDHTVGQVKEPEQFDGRRLDVERFVLVSP